MSLRLPARKTPPTPRIVQGARLLAALSVIWSAYAITDLMQSGPWGLTVAIAGDIGWITVLWAEANRVRIRGRTWPATAAGWLIAAGVGTLLAIHGGQGPDGSAAQGAAGVFVIAVSKIVWLFALEGTRDPAALTPAQEAALADARRDQAYGAELNEITLNAVEQDAAARIARIRADGRVTLAQDEVDFEVQLERHTKLREIDRRTPLALSALLHPEPAPAITEQANAVPAEPDREQPNPLANTVAADANTVREQVANKATTSTNPDRGQPILADLVREQVASTTNNADAVRGVMKERPDANRDSVSAAVRRERRKTQGYA